MLRIVCVALVLLIGCGSSSKGFSAPTAKQHKLLITWQSDGNPLVPVCPATSPANCKSSITIRDVTQNTEAVLPITAQKYTAHSATDTYEVCVNGYDWQGLPISSPWEVVPKS